MVRLALAIKMRITNLRLVITKNKSIAMNTGGNNESLDRSPVNKYDLLVVSVLEAGLSRMIKLGT